MPMVCQRRSSRKPLPMELINTLILAITSTLEQAITQASLDPYDILIVTLVITMGGILQAATGLGAGLFIVPLIALISLDFIPGPFVFGSLSISLMMMVHERQHIKIDGLSRLIIGMMVGVILATTLITIMPTHLLGILFGIMILAAVGLSLKGHRIVETRNTLLGVGSIAGFMGASVGFGAPILALLYQDESGPRLRATLALLYFTGAIMILIALHLANHFGPTELTLGCLLIPGFIIGLLIAQRLAYLLDKGYTRNAVLIIATLSAITLITKSLTA